MQSPAARPRMMVVNHDASRSGAPSVGVELARTFREQGWDTTLVVRWWVDGPGPAAGAADRTVREPAAIARVALQRIAPLRPLARLVARRSIRALLTEHRPDLVWCNSVMTADYAVVATRLGIPVVLHSHERSDDVVAALTHTGFLAAQVASSPGVTLVACATATAQVLAEVVGVPPERVEVLHSTVDLDAVVAAAGATAPPSVGSPMVVGCGTGNATKGVDVFAAAAAVARRAGDGSTWVWVGAVPEELRTDAVVYPGPVPSAAPWLAAADVVVVPSRFEQLSLVAIEAMVLGTPVVASDVSGPREVLGDTGVFVPVGDAVAVRDAVAALLAHPEHSTDLAERAVARCRERWNLPRFRHRAAELAAAAVTRR